MTLAILAVLTDPRSAPAVLRAAAGAAAIDDAASIEALHVGVDSATLIMPTEEVMTTQRRAELDAMLAERARLLQLAFADWSQAARPVARRARGGRRWGAPGHGGRPRRRQPGLGRLSPAPLLRMGARRRHAPRAASRRHSRLYAALSRRAAALPRARASLRWRVGLCYEYFKELPARSPLRAMCRQG